MVLRKPFKDDYSKPKSYRPIALLDTIGKILESVIATRMAALTERYGLLPPTHYGGRKLKSTEHALHHIIETVLASWNKGETASMLCLDVAGAYDNVSHKRLLHNLRKRRIPPQLVGWVRDLLKDR